jgi:hypothetical protein
MVMRLTNKENIADMILLTLLTHKFIRVSQQYLNSGHSMT